MLDPMLEAGLRRGRAELNATRTALGLPPVTRLHGGMSQSLVLVGSHPQLEYPREWPAEVHVVGPLEYEPPYGPVEPPPGDAPLVLVAPSTAQDPEQRLLRAAVEGLADEPVRVLATWNRRLPSAPVRAPENTRLVEWVSYTRTMPGAAVVVLHAGHGTLARALTSGCRVLAVPHVGDMAENAARVDWAGVGARVPWRFCTPRRIRWALRRVLDDEGMASRVREIADWAAVHDGATRAAELVEALVGGVGGEVAGEATRPARAPWAAPAPRAARAASAPRAPRAASAARAPAGQALPEVDAESGEIGT
jgi:UDP:flavonoid glycosyltransferase YjiC (YdhE family)